jgi:hypothetical protein
MLAMKMASQLLLSDRSALQPTQQLVQVKVELVTVMMMMLIAMMDLQ